MQGLLGHSPLCLVAIQIPLILLLAIDRSGVAASTDGDAGLEDKRFNGAPYPDRFFLPFSKHPNVRKTLFQRSFMTTWTRILQEPVSLQVAVGSRVELQCEAVGNPSPQVYWFSGTEAESQIQEMITRAREDANRMPRQWDGMGQLTSTYVIDCVKPEDTGYRYCVSVSGGKVAHSKPALLLVDTSRTGECPRESQPIVTLHAPWRFMYQGNTVILPCRVEGQPMPYLYWLDNLGNRISTSGFRRRTVLPNGDLRIDDLKWTDMGDYTCRVQSGNTEKSVSTFLYPLKRSQ
ncbi:PREDICTED: neural/ectodermal development factor IMP-L2 isoform X2 [Dinoponera quadriceps]|uniref:Neural/ectodermal development factor IMP-L2 isoform X2 n=1 Tax=Dinoponera quadriceps TaxID=609295 RepID=A0A6P3XR19_DINQU|nr:PREDICTED: neural/ectodermal development factor IMP-L2 isoform X2 [Dinoponera quadriceps]